MATDEWPVATNPLLLVDPDSDEEKLQRGRDIIDLAVERDISGGKFLDFGCGEGHTTVSAKAAISVGYDIRAHEWAKGDAFFTTSWDEVASHGPYDCVLMFDVLDHLVGETPVDALKRVRSVLAEGGRIYARVHPFVSRHATHLYHDLNKAFLHLVFSTDELGIILPKPRYAEPNTGGVVAPFYEYGRWFEAAGLSIEKTRTVRDDVDEFFKSPEVAARIMKRLGVDALPEFQMSVLFVDYILKI